MTFCGQCGKEIAEKDSFCTVCGRKVAARKKHLIEAKIIDVEHVQSVNNWTDLYQSAKEASKKRPQKKVVKKEKEEKLGEYEKDYLKRLKKKPRKRAVTKKEKKEKLEKYVVSPVVPQQSTFSFSGNRLPTMIIAGFVLGFITFAIIGMASASDPYGCTQCDPFLSGYDGPPPIEMDLWVPDDYYYDDGYYDDGYYYDDYYYP